MKKLSLLIFVIMVTFFRCNLLFCSETLHWQGPAFGSTYSVTLADPLNIACRHMGHGKLRSFFDEFNNNLSTYDPNSKISQWNRSKSLEYKTDFLYSQIFHLSLHLCALSDGRYDISAAPLFELWAPFLHGKSATPPTSEEIQTKMGQKNMGQDSWNIFGDTLFSSGPKVELNVDSIAPGLAMDLLERYFWAHGCGESVIEIGGEVLAHGDRSFHVGLQAPDNLSGPVSYTVELKNMAIGTSGIGRKGRFYQGRWFSSFLNPRTGWPIETDQLQVSIAHHSGMWADGLATVMMLLPRQAAWDLAEQNHWPLLMWIEDKNAQAKAVANIYWTSLLPTRDQNGNLLPHSAMPIIKDL